MCITKVKKLDSKQHTGMSRSGLGLLIQSLLNFHFTLQKSKTSQIPQHVDLPLHASTREAVEFVGEKPEHQNQSGLDLNPSSTSY